MSFLDRLFSMRELSFTGDATTSVELARPLPAWAWLLIVLGVLAYAGWSYWRLQGSLKARAALATLRALTLLLLALLATGPRLVRQNERVEKDWVVVMIDRSASMQVRDGETDQDSTSPQRPTREAQLREALRAAGPSLTTLSRERTLLVLGFDSGAYELASPDQGTPSAQSMLVDLGEPAGPRTALGTSLDQALRRVAARPVSGLVLLSDGRSFDAPSRELLQQLKDRRVPVFAYALGNPRGIPDLALTRLTGPSAAFVGDRVPVAADVELLGTVGGDTLADARVQLVAPDGRVLDEQPVPALTGNQARVLLSASAREAGDTQWTVRLISSGPDLSSDNNQQALPLSLVDRPIRVLYLDGYPRWEYRYVKNLLLRERSIESTATLLADRRYLQEGTRRLDALPRSVQDWAQFDVVLLGDVRPGLFSEEQLSGLRQAVSERGLGLLWIGGATYTPNAWAATAGLGDLLPMDVARAAPDGPAWSLRAGVEAHTSPVVMLPGPAANTYGVLQLADERTTRENLGSASPTPSQGWPAFLSDASLGWPRLQWSQRIAPASLKPAVELLALARPIGTASEAQGSESPADTPLVMTMRFGAGRVVYIATDETWRYRYGRGETLTERFWIPLIRLLARGSLGRTGKPATIEASPDQPLVNQPVRIVVRLLDQSLVERRTPSISLAITPASDSPRSGPQGQEQLTLAPEGENGSMGGPGSSVSTYAGLWVPGAPGTFLATPTEALLGGLDLNATIRVSMPEDELRRPQADHAALADLTQQTGGRILTREDLAGLDRLLPNREVRTLGVPDIETLWDKPVVLALLLLLLALEWGGRRLIKLS